MSADLKVLVVDDNEDLAVGIRDILHEKGYRAAVAHTGDAAVRRCEEEAFDLVLLDFNLPDMDGLSAQERLTGRVDADFIIITGYASVSSAAAAVARPRIVGYETKPLDVDRLLTLIRQIGDRRRTERALAKSRARYETLYGAITDALFVHSLEADGSMGRFLEVNDIACARYGYFREEMLRMTPSDLDDPDSDLDVPAVLDKLGRGMSMTFEQVHVARDGRRIPVEIHARTFQLDGKSGVICLVRDITERKRAEKERRRMERRLLDMRRHESLGVMAGGIAHDFNNILAVVIGNLDLAMEESGLSHGVVGNLAASRAAAMRAAGLVNQMLAFSGKGHFQVDALDLNEVAAAAAAAMISLAPPGATLVTRPHPAPLMIDADAPQLRQIISNLVINAFESLGEGESGRVILSTGVEECGPDRIEQTAPEAWLTYEPSAETVRCAFLEVRDNGRGMDPETRKRIFEPFFTSKFHGRGLGMCAVIGIVRGHGGYIHVDSRPGDGATIRVLFPLMETADGARESDAPAMGGSPAETTLPPSPCAGAASHSESPAIAFRSVMVVDDEAPVRTLLRMMLEKEGRAVVTAANGMEAVTRYHESEGRIDLILMDLSMPLMGGVEAFVELRRTGCAAPVILTSGYSEQQIKKEMGDKGFAAFLQKPFSKGQLMALLDRLAS